MVFGQFTWARDFSAYFPRLCLFSSCKSSEAFIPIVTFERLNERQGMRRSKGKCLFDSERDFVAFWRVLVVFQPGGLVELAA